MYALITLKDGTKIVSEFTKLRGLGTYASRVMSGAKALNVWKVVAHVHPASGEKCLVRSRRQISGDAVLSMEEVVPKTDATPESVAALNPVAFTPALSIEKGAQGLYTFPATGDVPDGAVRGIAYPLHRDPDSLRRFVILNAEAGTKHFIDEQHAGVHALPETEEVDNFGSDDDDDIF